jgi:WD40 repeat protein/energy-coupling factor transporter ATP-binding protein EcfA2
MTVLSYREVRRPYPGLRPFEPFEMEIFRGRDAQVRRLLEILSVPLSSADEGAGDLEKRRFLAVIGPSGCGKSSLVRAGLLPAIAAGLLGTGSDWRILIMQPRAHPIHELTVKLTEDHVFGPELGATDHVGLIQTELARGRRGLIDVFQLAARRVKEPQRLNLLVLVDQFEELFTQAKSAEESSDFVNLLLAASAEPGVNIHVVLTMRTDFLGHCVRFLDLPDAVNRGMFLTPRLNRDEMREAIAGPAASFGGSVDDQLVGELINGVGGDSDELPIMQHALARVWEHAQKSRNSTALVAQDLADVGGLDRALSAHADAVYQSLLPKLQPITKKLFQFLTERTSPEAGNRDVRRAREFKEIAVALGCETSMLVPIVEAFAEEGVNFLTHGSALDDGSMIEISHEALIRKWDRLKGWVAEEAARAAGYRRWKERALGRSARLTTSELFQAISWRNGDGGDPPSAKWALRYGNARDFEKTIAYIKSSERKSALIKLAVAAAAVLVVMGLGYVRLQGQQKLRADEQRKYADEQRKHAEKDLLAMQREQETRTLLQQSEQRRLQAEIASNLKASENARKLAEARLELSKKSAEERLKLVRAETDAKTAQALTRKAITAQLMSESQLALASDPERAQLLAIEAYRRDPSVESESLLRAVRLRYASLLQTLRGHTGRVRRAVFSPNGNTLLTVGGDGTVKLWDSRTGRSLPPPAGGYGNRISDVAYNADGTLFLAVGGDRRVRVCEVATGRPIGPLSNPGYVYRAVFSPKGRFVAAACEKNVLIWDLDNPKVPLTLSGHKVNVLDLAYSPDGKKIATSSSDRTVRLWDANDGTPNPPASIAPSDISRRVVFNNDGTRLLTVNNDKTAQIWNTATGAQVGESLTGHTGTINQAAFSPDGKAIVTGAADGTARVWDAVTGKKRRIPVDNGNRSSVLDFSLRGDGKVIIIASADGTAQLFAGGSDPIATFDAHHGPVSSVAFSPDGNTVVTAHDDAARLWDTNAGRAQMTLPGHESSDVQGAAFTSDGKHIVTASDDQTTQVWDVAANSFRTGYKPDSDDALVAILSPDGTTMLSFVDKKNARLLDAMTGHLIAPLALPAEFTGWAFSRDGKRFIIAMERKAQVFEATSGKVVSTLEAQEELGAVDLSPDGKLVVTGCKDGAACLWNANRGRQVHALETASPGRLAGIVPDARGERRTFVAAAFSPEGDLVATLNSEGKVRLWDTRSGQIVAPPIFHKNARQIVFSTDGNAILTMAGDRRARLWNVHTGTLSTTFLGQSEIAAAAFSRNGLLATAEKGAIRLWEPATSRLLALLQADQGSVQSISFSPDGRLLLSFGDDGPARVWDVSAGRKSMDEVIADIQHRVARDLTADEWEELHLETPTSEKTKSSSQ